MTDFHKRSGKRRRNQDLDPFAHRRSPEENRALKHRAAERRKQHAAERRPRQHDWEGSDREDAGPRSDSERSQPSERHARRATRRGKRSQQECARQPDRDSLIQAVVCSPGRTQLLVQVAGRELVVRLSPAWMRDGHALPVVGDHVLLAPQKGTDPLLVELLPRTGVLTRGGSGGVRRALAAHVELGVLVLSMQPDAFRPGLVDRACLALRRGDIAALVVLNKRDLVSDAERVACEVALADQRESGLEILAVSATTGAGLAALRERIAGRRIVFFGHSGVGKSTLLNALDPEGLRKLGAVRAGDGKGRHTTTSSGLVRLADGTELIDTPGVRAFGLGRVQPEELDELFPVIASLATHCRFNDCAHDAEPGCALRAALASGELGAARWARYERLARGQD